LNELENCNLKTNKGNIDRWIKVELLFHIYKVKSIQPPRRYYMSKFTITDVE